MLMAVVVMWAGDEATVATRSAPASTSTTTTTWRVAAVGCRPVAEMTLRQRLAQLVMVNLSTDAASSARDLLARVEPPGGLVLTGDADADVVNGSIATAAAATPTIVAIDDEGGRVQALGRAGFPSARKQAATLTLDAIGTMAADRAARMVTLGVTMDLAPVVDVSSQPDDGPIGDRSYGSDANTVVRNAGAFASGLRRSGILPTLKHFPGHGSASGDSHLAPVSTPDLATLRASDLKPYRALLPTGPMAVLTGHLDVPGLTEPNVPASLSPATYALLRGELAFDGLAVTDDLGGMAAVSARYGIADAAVRAIVAGADMAMIGPASSMDAVLGGLEAAATTNALPEARVTDALRRVRTAQSCNP